MGFFAVPLRERTGGSRLTPHEAKPSATAEWLAEGVPNAVRSVIPVPAYRKAFARDGLFCCTPPGENRPFSIQKSALSGAFLTF